MNYSPSGDGDYKKKRMNMALCLSSSCITCFFLHCSSSLHAPFVNLMCCNCKYFSTQFFFSPPQSSRGGSRQLLRRYSTTWNFQMLPLQCNLWLSYIMSTYICTTVSGATLLCRHLALNCCEQTLHISCCGLCGNQNRMMMCLVAAAQTLACCSCVWTFALPMEYLFSPSQDV